MIRFFDILTSSQGPCPRTPTRGTVAPLDTRRSLRLLFCGGKLFTLSLFLSSFIFFLFLTPTAHAERWIEGDALKTLSRPYLTHMLEAHCQTHPCETENTALALQVPDNRKFRMMPLLTGEPLTLDEAASSLTPSVFERGYGLADLRLIGTLSGESFRLKMPVMQMERIQTWVLTQDVKRGEPVAGHLTRKETLVNPRQKHRLLKSDHIPPEATLRIDLAAGEPLTRQNLNVPPTIQAWEPVQLIMVVRRGKVPVKMKLGGTALQSGYEGDTIRVRQENFQKKTYSGTVLGKGLVEVTL